MILDLETEIFLIAFAVIAVGATIQGLAGFGMNTLAAPLLFMLEPDMVPGPILVAALFHTMMTAWRERGDIKFNEVGRMYVGAVLGILAGTATAAALSNDGSRSRSGACRACLIRQCRVGIVHSCHNYRTDRLHSQQNRQNSAVLSCWPRWGWASRSGEGWLGVAHKGELEMLATQQWRLAAMAG